MKILKRVFILATAFALIAGGGGVLFANGAAAGTKGKTGKIQVVFAGVEAASTGQSRTMQEVADILNASGRFDATVQVNGALSGDIENLVTQAKTGVPLVVSADPTRLASQFQIPDLNILGAPYIFTDPTILQKLPETSLFNEWQKKLEAEGITFLATAYNGFRSFYTTKPITKVADLKGLRIRGFGNDMGNALAKYLGFANMGIAWGEVIPAIQQKTLDGCEVQISAAWGASIYDVVKYVALTKHYMLQSSFVCSTKLLNDMPEADRELFIKTIRDTARKYNDIILQEENDLYKQLEAKGVTVTEVNLQEFQSALDPLYTNNDLKFSAGLKERLFKELGL
jgi:TRAP-type C4-dicarboxylate transport system substrate-binding protein